jgi:hypothetical protein
MIQSIQFPDELMKLFDETLLNVWKGKEKDWGKEVKAKENRIRFLQSEKKRIEQYLLSGKGSVALQTKMDENWAEFDVEEKML